MPLIVGSPRSGTTLLRLMLDSHSELTIPETGFLVLGPKLRGAGDRLRERFFHAVINYPQPFCAWPDFEIPEAAFWEALTEISPFNISEGFRAFYRLYAARLGKPRWGDKTPLYCKELNTIRQVLPEARFIHLIRDGRDSALSLRRMWFSPGWQIETQAAYWRKNILLARRAGLGRPDYMEVRYEDLILSAGVTLERICAFAGLNYEDDMLTYYARPDRLEANTKVVCERRYSILTREERLRQQSADDRTAGSCLRVCLEAADEH